MVAGKTSRDIGLLRTIARSLVSRPLPAPPAIQQYLRAEGLAYAIDRGDQLLAIRQTGSTAFRDLSESVIEQIPGLARGTRFAHFQRSLFQFLSESYLGRDPSAIVGADAAAVVEHFSEWFADLSQPRRVFVPCFISPWAAPRFSIGAVSFTFINDVARSEVYPSGTTENLKARHDFDQMLNLMKATRANWLACASIEGCEHQRAEEIGNLVVDLAIVALQLAAPYLDTRTMGRLDARRGFHETQTLSEANGYYNQGWHRREAGLAIGAGALADILRQTQPLTSAVGKCVQSFATNRFRLPNLERAWCDAAYWLHQGLAEPVDTIAVAKLETALEVLLFAESSAGSKRRMLQILECFYDLQPADALYEGAEITTSQFASAVASDRSRVLHGTLSTLNTRLARNRDGLEHFVGPVISRAALELDQYGQELNPIDDIDGFLAWVNHKKSSKVT